MTTTPADTLSTYALDGEANIYFIGTFDREITVLSQQVRALNFVWALAKAGALPNTSADAPPTRIAIVGGGFAGLTVAAGLLKKQFNVELTVFERRDTLLPLQLGSDSRWLHPHIYDWPRAGSEAFSAALPVLNWTASRASDVVAQTMDDWQSIVAEAQAPKPSKRKIRVYCNTKHLQISHNSSSGSVCIEWVGHQRVAETPSIAIDNQVEQGAREDFDLAVLAVGFGLEAEAATSYWRNETLAQPGLGQARTSYIVSGSGDGAMIDLFRLRIAQYRQDRILGELFSGKPELTARLRLLLTEIDPDTDNTFDALDTIWNDEKLGSSTRVVLEELTKRLRHDTSVVLHTRSASFAELFTKKRVSFQNRLLAYLLYRSGGFFPSTLALDEIAKEHGVTPDRIIIRHGTKTIEGVGAVLSAPLKALLGEAKAKGSGARQTDDVLWSGGYFDTPWKAEASSGEVSDDVKAEWRKEYLPTPTRIIASNFCAAVSGFLEESHPNDKRLRVVLHRRVEIGSETVLQQCSEYHGMNLDAKHSAAGRTFPSRNATIGVAFASEKIVRTQRDTSNKQLNSDMGKLGLNEASRDMARDVESVVAIPLRYSSDNGGGANCGVVAVLYIDSGVKGFFEDEKRMEIIVKMCQKLLNSLSGSDFLNSDRLANTDFWSSLPAADSEQPLPALESLEYVRGIAVPTTTAIRQLNFDFSDFVHVGGK